MALAAFRSGFSGVWSALLVAVCLLVLQGCATHSAGFAKIEQEASSGNLDAAIKMLDDEAKRDLTGADRTLDALNRAMLLRMKGAYAASNTEFDLAKRLSEELAATSVSEQAAALAINEGQKSYEAYPDEQLLVYAFKALNYLQAGDFDGAAVEARQFDIRHRLIVESHPEAKYLAGAFVRYLNGLVYEAVGERDAARIEFEKAAEGYRQQESITRLPVPQGLLNDLARVSTAPPAKAAPAVVPPSIAPVAKPPLKNAKPRKKGDARNEAVREPAAASEAVPAGLPQMPASTEGVSGEVVFVLHNGLGPQLAESVIELPNPVPEKGVALLRVALPKFVARPVPVARVEISAAGRSAASELVEDTIALARAGLDDRLPGIQARGLARLVAKNVAVKEAKKKAEKKGSNSGGLLALGMEIAAIATERADTRTWSLMPGNVHLARLALPPGRHDLTVNLYDAGGRGVRTRKFSGVEIRAGRRVFLADYYLPALAAKK